jgi:hypothetical protein
VRVFKQITSRRNHQIVENKHQKNRFAIRLTQHPLPHPGVWEGPGAPPPQILLLLLLPKSSSSSSSPNPTLSEGGSLFEDSRMCMFMRCIYIYIPITFSAPTLRRSTSWDVYMYARMYARISSCICVYLHFLTLVLSLAYPSLSLSQLTREGVIKLAGRNSQTSAL